MTFFVPPPLSHARQPSKTSRLPGLLLCVCVCVHERIKISTLVATARIDRPENNEIEIYAKYTTE